MVTGASQAQGQCAAYTKVFAKALMDEASGRQDRRHHAAMRGTGLDLFERLSERTFDVGIAEQHA